MSTQRFCLRQVHNMVSPDFEVVWSKSMSRNGYVKSECAMGKFSLTGHHKNQYFFQVFQWKNVALEEQSFNSVQDLAPASFCIV
jgi:hypothetical protein